MLGIHVLLFHSIKLKKIIMCFSSQRNWTPKHRFNANLIHYHSTKEKLVQPTGSIFGWRRDKKRTVYISVLVTASLNGSPCPTFRYPVSFREFVFVVSVR